MANPVPGDSLLEQSCPLPNGDCIEIRLVREARGLAYRLSYLRAGDCLLRYEHSPALPHARILRGRAAPYAFRSVEQLRYDFERDLEAL